MAKNKSLSDAIQEMIDNVEVVAATAGLLLQDKIKSDFQEAAKKTIDMYYEYQNGSYTRSGRKHNLYNIYDVRSKLKKNGKNYTITTSIDFDASKLDGLYRSNSKHRRGSKGNDISQWSSWPVVDGDYVFENFLAGEHPWTRFEDGEYIYGENVGQHIPDEILARYVREYGAKYFENHFQKLVAQLLKQYL